MATLHDRLARGGLNGILDEFDVGTTDANGDIRLLSAADAELAQPQFANPAFANAITIGGGIAEAQANAIAPDNTITPSSTFTKVQLRDRDNVVLFAGSVGLPGSGADLIVSDNVIPPTATGVVCGAFSAALALVA